MLAEGRRRAENGERVAVGWIESHGRPQTSRQLSGLEVIAPRTVACPGAVFAGFDAPAAIASGADVVLTWAVVGSAGPAPPTRPENAGVDADAGDRFGLAPRGHQLPADERRILGAIAAQAAVTVEQRRLAEAAAAAKPLAEADKICAALLATAGRDLRTPLAAAKDAVSLRASDATWKPEQARELAAQR